MSKIINLSLFFEQSSLMQCKLLRTKKLKQKSENSRLKKVLYQTIK